jgi:hypothetical protein
MDIKTGSSPGTSLSPANYHPTNAPFSHLPYGTGVMAYGRPKYQRAKSNPTEIIIIIIIIIKQCKVVPVLN